jgi:hypothetical protein
MFRFAGGVQNGERRRWSQSDVDAHEQLIAENETLFREVNERLDTRAPQLGPDAPHQFLCECASAGCTLRLTLPAELYELVRGDPRQFVVVPGHYTPRDGELVVEEETHWIVRKSGEAGEYAAALDPRR